VSFLTINLLIGCDIFLEVIHDVGGEYDMNEPTMAEKLASLDLVDDDKSKSISKLEPYAVPIPPSADSVHVLLKQALHADDHTLLLDCLYTRDEKVCFAFLLFFIFYILVHYFAFQVCSNETYIELVISNWK